MTVALGYGFGVREKINRERGETKKGVLGGFAQSSEKSAGGYGP